MRRMIAQKDADKLRFIERGGDTVSLVNDDDAQIILDGDDIRLYGAEFQIADPDSNLNYFQTNSDHVEIHTPFVAMPNDHPYIIVESDGIFMDLPAADPHNKGYLWNDNGIVKISLG